MEEKEKFISKAPIRRMMKGCGASLVAEEALIALIKYLQEYGGNITKKAIEIAVADKRKRLTGDDIEEAVNKL